MSHISTLHYPRIFFNDLTAHLTASVPAAGEIDCKVNGRFYSFLILGLLVLLASACGTIGTFGPTEPSIPTTALQVDLLFKEYYQALGGPDVLGPIISDPYEQDGIKCQFAQAALMCFDESAAENNHRYSLVALGLEMQVRDDPSIPVPVHPDDRDLGDGFHLFHEFSALYDRMYGDLYAGRPLTQLRVNHVLQRYEQFFENVGFYRGFSEPAGQAHLVHYGTYLCGQNCSRELDDYWAIVKSGQITQPFELGLQRLGWHEFGRPLAQARLSSDGFVEQLYEKALLYAPVNDLNNIRLRPLVLWAGLVVVQPLAEKNPHEQLVFYEIENGLGHNVPTFFDSFIASHGGREMAGKPLTEFFPEDDGGFCQCFENFCLDYDPAAIPNQRVSMTDIGWQYASGNNPQMVAQRQFGPANLAIELSETNPQIGKGEQQRINFQVLRLPERTPVQLATGLLTINIPDLPALTLRILPTNKDGHSEVTIPGMDGLPNMSVIEYKACLDLPSDTGVCAVDSFVYRGE